MVTKTRKQSSTLRLTETHGPFPQDGKRYRQTFTTDMVAHRWSGNEFPSGRASRIYFRGGTIYSYGAHFPIARHVKLRKTGEHAILFTSRGYSSSTSKHKQLVRRAIPAKTTVFVVNDVDADTVTEHRRNLEVFKAQALELFRKSKKARENKAYLLRSVVTTIRDGNRYAEAVGLQDRIGPPQDGDLASWEEKALEEAKIAQAKADRIQKARTKKREELNEIRRKEEAVKHARRIDEYAIKLAAWQSGQSNENPGDHPDRRYWGGMDSSQIGDFVRVSRDKYLQTTKGMSVPLKDVLPVLEAIREESPQPGRTFKIQEFDGEILWEDKVFLVGCHRIQFAEIERAAKAAGL